MRKIRIELSEQQYGQLQDSLAAIATRSYAMAIEDPMESRPLQVTQHCKQIADIITENGRIM